MDPKLKAKLQKQRYHIVGEHGGVKTCHWTKESLLRGRQCYKGRFYGIESHGCMQMSPVVDQCVIWLAPIAGGSLIWTH